MSGKQYSLDSRIDLAEAVDEVNYEDRASVEKIEEEEDFVVAGTGGKGRSLSVIENSEVASQVKFLENFKRNILYIVIHK